MDAGRSMAAVSGRGSPETKLALVGNNLPAEICSGHDDVVPIGRVEDLAPVFAQHRVFVSPIRVGTGIKTKNLAALAHGLPLVTTSVGAKGMRLTDGTNALIADTSDDFAGAIIRVYTEDALWERLSREGKRHLAIEFGQPRLEESVSRLVERTKEIHPGSFQSSHVWSCRLVEERFPQLLELQPGVNLDLFRITSLRPACRGASKGRKTAGCARPSPACFQLYPRRVDPRSSARADLSRYGALLSLPRRPGSREAVQKGSNESALQRSCLLQLLSVKTMRWLLSFSPQRRLHRQCLVWMIRGQILELYRRTFSSK